MSEHIIEITMYYGSTTIMGAPGMRYLGSFYIPVGQIYRLYFAVPIENLEKEKSFFCSISTVHSPIPEDMQAIGVVWDSNHQEMMVISLERENYKDNV